MSESPSPESPPTAAYDYELPRDLIASHPARRRDESRLLVLHRDTGHVEHRAFADIVSYVPAGDALVLNETRVLAARLRGQKTTGARAEVLLLHPLAVERPDSTDDAWVAVVRPGARLRPGSTVVIADDLHIDIADTLPDGRRVVHLRTSLSLDDALDRYGEVPLPPYIEREVEPADRERYQTVYAREPGSVAAPTAGLHFTPALLQTLEARGVGIVRLVLHIGLGTFRPVEVDDPADHPMHAERYSVSDDAAARLNAVRTRGGRLWAVGTTVTRTLETCSDDEGYIRAGSGWTSLFIRPPYRFRAVDRLITNFHLPRSTLIMLVAALAGHEHVMAAYREAVAHRYRFYSYGDVMLIL